MQAPRVQEPPAPLYCVCRQPDDYTRSFVECEFCEEWFHPECVGTTVEVSPVSPLPCN